MLPIVLIHGFPFDATMWEGQAAFLREKGLKVATPTLPGFAGGEDGWTRERTSIESYAEYIHQVIQKDAGGRAIVGGFSMGGYILLALLRDHPECVAAAMLIDTRADADTAQTRAERMKSIEEIEKNGPEKVFEAMVSKVLAKKPAAGMREKARAMMYRQKESACAANALWAMAKRRDQSDLLPVLKIPVLIVVGAEDAITPPSVALAMQSHMPHAMVVQVVSAGHLSPVEQTGAVNGAIETFLATIKTE